MYMHGKQPLVKGLIAAEDVAAAVVFLLERRIPVHYRRNPRCRRRLAREQMISRG